MNHPNKKAAPTLPLVGCAIYTRKSTEEGLEQEFNSLDAQRESAEAFIRSQSHEGWTCLPDRYDDGGFTGGNMERPALQRLLADIRAGKIDTVGFPPSGKATWMEFRYSFQPFKRPIVRKVEHSSWVVPPKGSKGWCVECGFPAIVRNHHGTFVPHSDNGSGIHAQRVFNGPRGFMTQGWHAAPRPCPRKPFHPVAA